jgi:2-keto-4-pentenoate hydratase
MDEATADRAADVIISLYRGTATERPLKRFPEDCRPASFFDVQMILQRLTDGLDRPIQGWKLYFPFKAGQPNLVAPIYNVLRSGDHITHEMSRLHKWEAEIVFRANRDLPPRAERYTYEEVAQATDAAPAIEFFATRFDVESLDELAGLTFERYSDFSTIPIRSWEGDELVGDIRGGHPVIDPFILVFVGANTARLGHGIRKGQILATLSPSPVLDATPNARIRSHFDGLGGVEAVFDY